MKQRLQTILSKENLPSSKFADIIGVNRSSISHLLSGRNNPSLDVLQKVLVKFPHINPDWLLLGEGEMYRSVSSNDRQQDNGVPKVQNELFSGENKTDMEHVNVSDKIPQNRTFKGLKKTEEKKIEDKVASPEIIEPQPKEHKESNSEVINSHVNTNKKAVKIVFFYSDNTFDTYYPND